jgi:hypothetical protein
MMMTTKSKRRPVKHAVVKTVTVPVPSQTAEVIDDRREAATEEARKTDTLKRTLIDAVKAHARKHYEDGTGWNSVVETMSDEDIWDVIQWCDFERGAVGMMARKVKRLAVAAEVTA